MPPERQPPQPSTPGTPAIHAPWRMSYMQMLSAADKAAAARSSPAAGGSPSGSAASQASSSFFRDYFLHPEQDDPNHVVARVGSGGTAGLILLNKYPYSNGHLLIALGEARPRLLDYTPEQRAALWTMTDLAVELCEKTLFPQGVNVGLNQATAAGAGVPGHVHVHVVPRWVGDVNFMSVVGQVRVIPGALDDMHARYKEVWKSMRPNA